MDIATLITHLTTMDAAAERKFNATSQDMVRLRTDEIRRHIANGMTPGDIYHAVVNMKGWACFGSLQAINWLDSQLDLLAAALEPEAVALDNAEVAAHITSDLIGRRVPDSRDYVEANH